jgi:hypothetical protein
MSKHSLLIASLYLLAGVVATRGGEFQSPVEYPPGPYPEFQAHVDFRTGLGAFAVAIGDFNTNGNADLAVANLGNGTLSVLLGHGDGTFRAHEDYGLATTPYSIAIGDLNGDGKLDLVLPTLGYRIGGQVSVLLGNGDGTFQSHQDYLVGTMPVFVAIGDVNGDGKPDLVVTNHGQTNGAQSSVSVLLGNGDGTFQPQVKYSSGKNPHSAAIGDFNGDGKQDLVVANQSSDTVSVVMGNGDGTFQFSADCATGDTPESVILGDFNRDGKVDLAVANCGPACGSGVGSVSVLLGNGDGTFQTHVDYPTEAAAFSVAEGDFNGDGKADLVTANSSYPNYSTVNVFLGRGDGTFRNYASYSTALDPSSVAGGDVNNDGAPDLVTANFGDSTVSVLLNTGGTFVTTTSSSNPSRLGQPVTFTTTVTAGLQGVGTPTGTVTFRDGETTLGTATLISGQASVTTSSLSVGKHNIRARYFGDSTFNPHNALPIIQKVLP